MRDSAPAQAGSPQPALHHPRTARALARHRGRSLRWLAVGVLMTIVFGGAAWTGSHRGIEWLKNVGSPLLAAGLVCLALGVCGLYANVRMRQSLKTGPWLTRRAHQFPPSRLKGVGLVLLDPSGALCPLLILATRQRHQRALTGSEDTLWWCPGPTGRGVLVRPEGDELLYARPPFTTWGRRTRIEDATRAGLGA
ncbi:hypothetical protein [Streptomyces sp. NPDC055060]